MAVFIIDNSSKALDLDKIEFLDLSSCEVRFVSGKTMRLDPNDFQAVLDKLKGAS